MEINKPRPPSPIPHPPSPIPHPLRLIGATTVFEPPLRWSLTLAIFPPHVNCKKLEHDWVQIHHHQPPPFFFSNCLPCCPTIESTWQIHVTSRP